MTPDGFSSGSVPCTTCRSANPPATTSGCTSASFDGFAAATGSLILKSSEPRTATIIDKAPTNPTANAVVVPSFLTLLMSPPAAATDLAGRHLMRCPDAEDMLRG